MGGEWDVGEVREPDKGYSHSILNFKIRGCLRKNSNRNPNVKSVYIIFSWGCMIERDRINRYRIIWIRRIQMSGENKVRDVF